MATIGAPPQQVTPAAPREPHLLSLKVLRAARPALVPSSHPYIESTSLAASSISHLNSTSIDAQSPQEHALTGTLVLPSTFGTIYLGETFSALLCLSNDSPSPPTPTNSALSPILKVEMHTTGPQNPTSAAAPAPGGGIKHHLATIQAQVGTNAIQAGGSVEGLVSHEIKELGLHALVCTVTYGCKLANGSTVSRSFRKVYKFQISNPLSVRTKAHSPSPLTATSSLSPLERTKVFLEVQVQNLNEHSMSFERMNFDPIPLWSVVDLNSINPLFEGEDALLSPGSVRQYVYILQPPKGAVNPPPGSSQPLGRLDIQWRTPHGEVGRLTTSMLGRRIPALPAAPLPLEKSTLITTNPAIAPSPPILSTSTSNIRTPAPYRPTSQVIVHELPNIPTPPPPPPPLEPSSDGLEFDLLVTSISPDYITIEKPFKITFSLGVRNRLGGGKGRKIRVAIQYVNYFENSLIPLSDIPLPPHPNSAIAPNPSIAITRTPPPLLTTPTQPLPQSQQPQNSLLLPSLSTLSTPSISASDSRRTSLESTRSALTATAATQTLSKPPPIFKGILLPPPTPILNQNLTVLQAVGGPLPSRDAYHLGPSILDLGEYVFPPISRGVTMGDSTATLKVGEREEEEERDGEGGGGGEKVWEFSTEYVGMESGLMRVGGVRVFLMEEGEVSEVLEGKEEEGMGGEGERRERRAKCVWERAVVAEVWVASVEVLKMKEVVGR